MIAPHTTLIDCTGHPVTRPAAFVLTCGDANTALSTLRWNDWGSPTAEATGTETVNTCHPDCVSGHDVSFPVRVRAERRRDGSYRLLVVTAGADRPHGTPRVVRYTPVHSQLR